MSRFSDALAAKVGISAFQQAGADVALTWDTAVTGPILDQVALVVLPDFHLASGGAGDIFRGNQGTGAGKLKALLQAILDLAPSFPELVVVHLGDLYDVWRAYPAYSTHPTSDYTTIERPYSEELGLLTEEL